MNADDSLKLYFHALRIRRVEEAIAKRYADQKMRCPVHLSIGQEAAAVAMAQALRPTDLMVSTHRGHAHYLAKGGSLKAMLSELHGKLTGCAKGQGGSMHLVDESVGFVGSTSIVGGTIPVGVGTAFASWLKGEKRVSVVCIGDAAVEEGVFHESANIASVHKLPVIFACENNGFSCYTNLRERQPTRPVSDVAIAHGMKKYNFDGNELYSLHESLTPIADAVRDGAGPVFVEMKTFRMIEHCGPNNDDHLGYREPSDIEHWKQNDAISKAKQSLVQKGFWTEEFGVEIEKQIASEIDDAFEFALNAPFPTAEMLGSFTYASAN